MGRFTLVFVCILGFTTASACAGREQPPGVCALTVDHTQTVPGLGKPQGVFVNHGFVYFLGDTEPSIAIEYLVRDDDELVPSGRKVSLAALGHPQGLTSRDGVGTFLGDTRQGRGDIYGVDWPRALSEGHLDGAVLQQATDSRRRNGLHPELVRVDGEWLIATATYGPTFLGHNTIELLDPTTLVGTIKGHRVRARFGCDACGTFIQSLHYDETNDLLVLVQNETKWRGWRLTFIDVAQSALEGEAHVTARLQADFTDELEGYGELDDGRAVFLSNRTHDNVRIGRVQCDVALRDR